MLKYPLRECFEGVKERIRLACERSGREPLEVELVAVTKGIDSEQIKLAYGLGIRDFGENKVQEFLQKKAELPGDIRWHFIGHLQTNKAKKVVGQTALIHSIDRLEAAEEMQKEALKQNATVDFLIQANVSLEETKFGFEATSVPAAVKALQKFDRLRIRGLMTIGPHTEDAALIRKSFAALRELREKLRDQFPDLDWHYLSMGMSSDFEIAVEEGANLLRIGTAIFGPRT